MTTVTDDVARFLRAAAGSPQLDGDVGRFRAALAGHLRHAGPGRPVYQVIDQHADGVRWRIYRPDQDGGHPVLIYLHGGAFVRGDLTAADVVCREIAARARAVVVSVDYRLAPEHAYPAALDDTRTALTWTVSEIAGYGGDPTRISIGGDSAGATIATVTAAENGDVLRCRVLISGVYDLLDDFAEAGRELTDVLDVPADARRLDWIAGLYAGPADRAAPRLSPLRAVVQTGPPALVVVSSLDPFAGQGRRLATALRRDGIDTELFEVAGMPHGFTNLAGLFPAAASTVYDRVAAALRDGVRGTG